KPASIRILSPVKPPMPETSLWSPLVSGGCGKKRPPVPDRNPCKKSPLGRMPHPFAGAGICRFRGQKTFRFFYPPCKELLIKKKRTRTLPHRGLGSDTPCLVVRVAVP